MGLSVYHKAVWDIVANQNNELVLTSQTGKQIAADRIMADICSDFIIPLDAEVDVVVIMDCCHSYLFTRTANEDHRRVDVLSAGNREDPKSYDSCGTFSFTSKLSVEIQKRAQRGDVEIEMAQLVSSIRETSSSPVKTPTYAAKLGLGSVVLPIIRLTPTASTTIPQDTSAFYPSGYLATFSLHIAETLNRSEIDKILHWIHQAPNKETSVLTLENVKTKENKLDTSHSWVWCHQLLPDCQSSRAYTYLWEFSYLKKKKKKSATPCCYMNWFVLDYLAVDIRCCCCCCCCCCCSGWLYNLAVYISDNNDTLVWISKHLKKKRREEEVHFPWGDQAVGGWWKQHGSSVEAA